jgi:hypothetical protein
MTLTSRSSSARTSTPLRCSCKTASPSPSQCCRRRCDARACREKAVAGHHHGRRTSFSPDGRSISSSRATTPCYRYATNSRGSMASGHNVFGAANTRCAVWLDPNKSPPAA